MSSSAARCRGARGRGACGEANDSPHERGEEARGALKRECMVMIPLLPVFGTSLTLSESRSLAQGRTTHFHSQTHGRSHLCIIIIIIIFFFTSSGVYSLLSHCHAHTHVAFPSHAAKRQPLMSLPRRASLAEEDSPAEASGGGDASLWSQYQEKGALAKQRVSRQRRGPSS